MSEDNFTKPPSPKRKKRKKTSTNTAKPKLTKKQKEIAAFKSNLDLEKAIAERKAQRQKIIVSEVKAEEETPVVDKTEGQKILWKPQISPRNGRSLQAEFLQSTEDEVLFSGGRSSGKSSALLVDPLRYVYNRNFRGLIIRKTMGELAELISRANILYKDAFPGVRWKVQEKIFLFPSGARIEFGYCDNKEDVERYRGQEYSWLGVDELTMFPTEEIYNALRSSVRTTDAELKAYTRCTSNPYGVGFNWVKKRFINQGPEGTPIVISVDTPYGVKTTTRKWFHSVPEDNPLVKDEYIAYLATLPEAMRKRWLEGSWDGGDGAAFPDFDRAKHVIAPVNIPGNWPRFRAIDYGYTTMGVCLWFAVDPEECLYIYREMCTTMVTAEDFARKVLEAEKGEYIQYGVIDGSIGANRGTTDPTLDELMRKAGLICRYSDRSAGSRMSGKNLMHQYLADDYHLKRPRLQIFEGCTELIDELSSLPSADLNPDDVQKKGVVDHAWDACRYGLLSRPKFSSNLVYEAPPSVDSYFF